MNETIIAKGQRVYLRDRIPEDAGQFMRWLSVGEWLDYDAPWEAVNPPANQEGIEAFQRKFLENCEKERSTPRDSAVIVTASGKPLGWVNRYGSKRFPGNCFVGIDICEDDYLNRGYGTDALALWITYLFTHGDFHRIGIETWSFNPRMSSVAVKLGFTHEGVLRELVEWQGNVHNMEQFSLLRREWEVLPWASR